MFRELRFLIYNSVRQTNSIYIHYEQRNSRYFLYTDGHHQHVYGRIVADVCDDDRNLYAQPFQRQRIGLARGIVVYQFQPCRLPALPEFA